MQRVPRKLTCEHSTTERLMARESQSDRHHCGFDFLHLVLRVLGVAPPRRLDESDGNSERVLHSAPFQNIVEVVPVSIAILPRHFALAAPRGARALEIEVEPMSLRDFAEDLANENLETVPNDLP